ncbi:MAG: hypothetical protein ACK6BM_12875 [Cyanobacteriota bacterium]
MMRALALVALLAFPLLGCPPLRAQAFDVYCTTNGDSTVSCSGWEGGEALTCVSNPGRTTTCRTASGRSFSCIQGTDGVTSCGSDPGRQGGIRETDCKFTGSGNLVCSQAPPPSEPLIAPPPSLEAPGLPTPSINTTVPSTMFEP